MNMTVGHVRPSESTNQRASRQIFLPLHNMSYVTGRGGRGGGTRGALPRAPRATPYTSALASSTPAALAARRSKLPAKLRVALTTDVHADASGTRVTLRRGSTVAVGMTREQSRTVRATTRPADVPSTPLRRPPGDGVDPDVRTLPSVPIEDDAEPAVVIRGVRLADLANSPRRGPIQVRTSGPPTQAAAAAVVFAQPALVHAPAGRHVLDHAAAVAAQYASALAAPAPAAPVATVAVAAPGAGTRGRGRGRGRGRSGVTPSTSGGSWPSQGPTAVSVAVMAHHVHDPHADDAGMATLAPPDAFTTWPRIKEGRPDDGTLPSEPLHKRRTVRSDPALTTAAPVPRDDAFLGPVLSPLAGTDPFYPPAPLSVPPALAPASAGPSPSVYLTSMASPRAHPTSRRPATATSSADVPAGADAAAISRRLAPPAALQRLTTPVAPPPAPYAPALLLPLPAVVGSPGGAAASPVRKYVPIAPAGVPRPLSPQRPGMAGVGGGGSGSVRMAPVPTAPPPRTPDGTGIRTIMSPNKSALGSLGTVRTIHATPTGRATDVRKSPRLHGAPGAGGSASGTATRRLLGAFSGAA
jgi:hypothetical protein